MGQSQFSSLSAGSRRRLPTRAAAGAMLLLAMAAGRASGAELIGQTTYRFAEGDRITINVLGQSDFSGDFLVDGAGEVSLPVVGGIAIGGMTIRETEREITKRLSDGYLRNPSVSVRINELRPIYVVGDVRLPGSYPYRYGASVLSAIALAGGMGLPQQLAGTGITEFLAADERVHVLENNRRVLLVKQARLEAQRAGARRFEAPDFVSGQKDDTQTANLVASERQIFDIQLQVLDKEVDLFRQQKPRMRMQIEAIKGQAQAEQRQLDLIQQRLQEYRALQSKGLGVSATSIEIEREQARNQGNIQRFAAELAQLELGLGEIDVKIQDAYNQFTRRVLNDLQDTRSRLQDIDAVLPTAREIRSVRLREAGAISDRVIDKTRMTVAIVRLHGRDAQTIEATEATPLEPGDVVEVRRILMSQPRLVGSSENRNDPAQEITAAAAAKADLHGR